MSLPTTSHDLDATAGPRDVPQPSGPGPVQPGPVMGDGTSARSRVGSRWRRWRWPLAIVALLVIVGTLAALPEPRAPHVALSPESTAPNGARAAAQILQRQGVQVTYVRRHADAIAAATPGTTLLLAGDQAILDEQRIAELGATGADLVLAGADWAASLLAGVSSSWTATGEQVRTLTARCDDPDAAAAGTLSARGRVTSDSPDVTVCFRSPDDTSSDGVYATTTSGGHRIDVLADAGLLTNDRLADEGNAALVLRLLGRHDRLVWYVPSLDDATGAGDEGSQGGPAIRDLVPPWAGVLTLELLLVVLVVAVVRGRRLGRVVTEPLPVTVRAAETTRGRGRLYRRGRAYGHAAAALRAGAAARCGHRLGLATSAAAAELIDAVALATGRPTWEVAQLFYGPPPTDDTALAQLARDLDDIESEVHRP